MRTIAFRLGHRYIRDDRTTTHLFLAARAFGADGGFYCGLRDKALEQALRKVVKSWGGTFEVTYRKEWHQAILEHKTMGFEVVHLTMYGQPVQTIIDRIRFSPKDKLIVVGGAKVPRIVYELADWNVAVTSQPHSEVSALSVFLHELFRGEELSHPFKGGHLIIVPQERGKNVLKK
jgi:tRNA (cytidine56-2'-O)-methyltransferase